MSKSYKKGFVWWVEQMEKRDRDRYGDDFPFFYHYYHDGHTFRTVDEYYNWYRRRWTSGKFGSTIGIPFSGTPKGYSYVEEVWGANRKRDAKRAVSRLIRNRGKAIIREALDEMEEGDDE